MLAHRPNVRPGLVLLAALATCLVDAGRPAAAAWPPPPDATSEDMKNPANWPSDPDYGYGRRSGDRKTARGFTRSSRSLAELPTIARRKAAGMSVDLAWRHIGDDRVLIACSIPASWTDLSKPTQQG
jgi:hypothetical protein